MNTAEKLRFYRKEKYFTQKKLSELTGIAEITIRQYESGKFNPKLDKLLQIANALDINVNCLLSDEDDSPILNTMKRTDSPLIDEYKQRLLSSEVMFTELDIEFIKLFHDLNKRGQEKLISYLNDLLLIEEYKKE